MGIFLRANDVAYPANLPIHLAGVMHWVESSAIVVVSGEKGSTMTLLIVDTRSAGSSVRT
jgi:hypothetical protein